MKKLILVLVFVICMLFVAGCDSKDEPDILLDYGNSFVVISEDYTYPILTTTLYHKETKVMYIIVALDGYKQGGMSISPLYDADGTLMIYEDSKS